MIVLYFRFIMILTVNGVKRISASLKISVIRIILINVTKKINDIKTILEISPGISALGII